MAGEFDPERHRQLLTILSKTDFVAYYQNVCRAYHRGIDVMDKGPDFTSMGRSFERHSAAVTPFKRFKTVAFDAEQIKGWTWTGKIVVQRHGVFEPMLEGWDAEKAHGVGSTWLALALDSGALMRPPIGFEELGPPDLPNNRPLYDGDPAMLDRLAPDLVTLFRSVKDAIRRSDW